MATPEGAAKIREETSKKARRLTAVLDGRVVVFLRFTTPFGKRHRVFLRRLDHCPIDIFSFSPSVGGLPVVTAFT